MKITPDPIIPGLWVIDLEPHRDERGHLVRTYCEKEFSAKGLNTRWPQCSLTLTLRRGMLRGMHFQAEPHPEIKLVRCAAGEIYDVVLDLRPGSPAFGRWSGIHLTGESGRTLHLAAGLAHGFQCLSDNCQVFYQMSEPFVPHLARGVLWNDPAMDIRWPLADPQVSAKDATLPTLQELQPEDLTTFSA